MPDGVLLYEPACKYGGPEHRKWPQERTASESHRTLDMRHIARPLGVHQIEASLCQDDTVGWSYTPTHS